MKNPSFIDDVIKEMSTEHEEAIAFNMHDCKVVRTYVTNGKLIVSEDAPAFLAVKRVDTENCKTYDEKIPLWYLAIYNPLKNRLKDIMVILH